MKHPGFLTFAVLVPLLVLATARGVSAQSGPAEPDTGTANVEVRVWQRIGDPLSIAISARPEGGSWSTLGTIPLPLDGGVSSSGRYRYGDIAVAVPLPVAEPATVEVRIWQRIASPLDIFISARPEGGSWDTIGTIPLPLDDGISRSGRYRYGDITVAVPLSGSPSTPTPTPAPAACHFEDSAVRVIASTVKVTWTNRTGTYVGTAFYVGNSQFVTAGHVVEGATSVTLSNSRFEITAHVVGLYDSDNGDVALLSASASGLTPLEWVGTVAVGEEIGFAGYPQGIGADASVGRGVVSRLFTAGDISYIQTDAAVSPGNSGSPLFDRCGRVAGVISSKLRESEGVAFAVAEPSLGRLLRNIRAGHSSTPAPTEPVWEQMDALVDRISEHWGPTIDALSEVIKQWNSSSDSIPSSRLASIARQERDLAQGMVTRLTPLRTDPATRNVTLSVYLEAAIFYWSAKVGEFEELEQYAWDRVTWGDVLSKRADSAASYATFKRASCETWTLLYSNPEAVCDKVVVAERAAADADDEAHSYSPPSVTTAPSDVLTMQSLDGRATLLAADGTYLGIISSNQYQHESVCNSYGPHGSPYRQKSVRNEYGIYGSEYFSGSIYNPYTSSPPRIYLNGKKIGYLTKNSFLSGAIDPDILFDFYDCVY